MIPQLLARIGLMERRHWVALGGSVVLHLAILLGLRQATPPEPEMVSFEVDLKTLEELRAQRPEVLASTPPAKAHKAKKARKPVKPKKAKSRKDKPKAEPHTLQAQFKTERKAPSDAPKVALPDLATAHAVADTPVPSPDMAAPKAKSARVAVTDAVAQSESSPVVSGQATPPAPAVSVPAAGTVTGAVASSSTPQTEAAGGEAATDNKGLTLAASQNLGAAPGSADAAQKGAHSGTPGSGLQDMAALGSDAQGANTGAGTANFSASAHSSGGLNLAAGSGANAYSASQSAPLAGGEPQGVRLTASGSLSSLPDFTQGKGGLASGALHQTAGMATPADGQGQGQALANARAGGDSVSPLAGPAAGPGKGGQGVAVERAANPGAAGSKGPGAGRLAGAAPGGKSLARASSARAGNSSQSGKSLALAPGEPGSGPQWAVMMLPVQTGVPVGTASPRSGKGQQGAQATHRAQTGPGGGDETRGSARALGVRLAQAPGGGLGSVPPRGLAQGGGAGGSRLATPGVAPGAAGGARLDGQGPGLSVVRPAPQKIVKVDSAVDTLDVLAPSNYCPLPFHPQPENRAPQAGEDRLELPSYATQNPSFVYPVMANVHGVEGKLILRVEVRADGTPGKMLLKQSSGNGILDRDAREQLSRWRFNPARKNGQAVAAWIDVPVVYRLPDGRK